MTEQASVVIVAAGSGVRFGSSGKVFSPLAGRPMVAWSLDAFSIAGRVGEIVLVAGGHTLDAAHELKSSGQWPKLRAVVRGGELRQDSVLIGLNAAASKASLVAIHDAARPLIDPGDIDRCIQRASETGAAILAVPIADTLKKSESGATIDATIDRAGVWAAQTPQVFERSRLLSAFERCRSERWTVTDEASMVERAGGEVSLVMGNPHNFKITVPEDAMLAERILAERRSPDQRITRTGLGYDVHRFAADRPLMLGGVEIPSDLGLEGHSDADILLHAITDALLGTAGLGDIGTHFPPSEDAWRNASSMMFLQTANNLLRSAGGQIVHIDATIIAEVPKIMPHAQSIRQSIAQGLGLDLQSVSVKATTSEGMGFIGRQEGMAALAIVTALVPDP